MVLGAALVLVGGAVLYFAVTGKDPRTFFAGTAPPRINPQGGVSGVYGPPSKRGGASA